MDSRTVCCPRGSSANASVLLLHARLKLYVRILVIAATAPHLTRGACVDLVPGVCCVLPPTCCVAWW